MSLLQTVDIKVCYLKVLIFEHLRSIFLSVEQDQLDVICFLGAQMPVFCFLVPP